MANPAHFALADTAPAEGAGTDLEGADWLAGEDIADTAPAGVDIGPGAGKAAVVECLDPAAPDLEAVGWDPAPKLAQWQDPRKIRTRVLV